MRRKDKATPIPKERTKTVRQEIIQLLTQEELTVGDLSGLVGKSEKEVNDQLAHIRKSVKLKIKPSECLNCGFVFRDRTRTRKPGKCPKCRRTRITEPIFSLRK